MCCYQHGSLQYGLAYYLGRPFYGFAFRSNCPRLTLYKNRYSKHIPQRITSIAGSTYLASSSGGLPSLLPLSNPRSECHSYMATPSLDDATPAPYASDTGLFHPDIFDTSSFYNTIDSTDLDQPISSRQQASPSIATAKMKLPLSWLGPMTIQVPEIKEIPELVPVQICNSLACLPNLNYSATAKTAQHTRRDHGRKPSLGSQAEENIFLCQLRDARGLS